MKKILLLTILSLQISIILAQNEAPNYFHANPDVFKYRLAEIRNDYSQYFQYEYDGNNYLVKEKCFDENGAYSYDIRYFYNPDGYMIRSETWGLTIYGEPIMQKLNEYTRDENGYITHYSRSTLHGDDPNDPTLTEDVRIDLQYNSNFMPTNAIISFYYDQNDVWIEGRRTTITYYGNNFMHEIIQYAENEEISREIFEYNANDKLSLYSFVSTNGSYEYSYIYDANSNIQKAGNENFWFEFQYNTDYMASETFLPRLTIDELVYFGFQNCTFRGLPYDNSKNAIIMEQSSGAEMIYEEINVTGLTHHEAADNKNMSLFISNNTLNINLSDALVGNVIRIYNINGVCLKSIVAADNSNHIDISPYATGCYIISVGKETQKIIIR